MGEMNSHSTVGGIWRIFESEVVVEPTTYDLVGPVPPASVTSDGQSQRNQGSDGKLHPI